MMPIIGIKCDKFVTKSQAPTTPYGVPPLLRYFERETIPRKNIRATNYYKFGVFYLEGCLTDLIEHLGRNATNYFLYRCVGGCLLGGYRSNLWNGVIDWG